MIVAVLKEASVRLQLQNLFGISDTRLVVQLPTVESLAPTFVLLGVPSVIERPEEFTSCLLVHLAAHLGWPLRQARVQ